jgi:beta-N-acetylhexosaminidase
LKGADIIKRISIFIIIISIISLLSSCSTNKNSDGNSTPDQSNDTLSENKPPNGATIEPPKAVIDPIKEKITALTIDEKIGQLVMTGINEYINDAPSKELIEKYHIGGFILLKQNIKDTNQTLNLINSLKETNKNNKIPLFISVDEEGGRVSRFPDEFKKLPSNKVIGTINNKEFSYKVGSVIGEELKSFGFNLNFAPVMDINSNPKNPVIGDRSFGNNTEVVSTLGIQTLKGLQAQNIIAAVKHFPGHGDTSVDSHVGLPLVNNDLDRLKSLELVPFKAAIENGADMVMIAHILLPKIDPENPSSFSKTIITDILRKDLGFDGVVITDDMTMGAIAKNYDIGEASVKSLLAGTDIILVCHDFNNEVKVLNAIKGAVESNKISESSLNDKLYRILKLKEKYKISDEKTDIVNVSDLNSKITNLLNTYIYRKQ